MTINESELLPIAREFYRVVMREWPFLAEFITVADQGDLDIVYPSPFREDGEPLEVIADTDLDETIINFGGGHSHGGPWQEPGDPDYQFQGAIDLINEIFREEVIGVTLTDGGAMGYTDQLRTYEWFEDITEVKSWKGTFDYKP